ncbi:SLC13 family permease [Thermodesulfovibrionales bacterium]|nr:SLC13 family permease [Thermodesulfovibrionales bacterium]
MEDKEPKKTEVKPEEPPPKETLKEPKGLIDPMKAVKPGESKTSIAIGLAIAIAAFITVAFIIPTPEGLTREGHLLFAIIVTAIILWVAEVIPIGITAIFIPGAMIVFGVQAHWPAWSGFAAPAVMFVYCIIMFGVILNQVGLAKRLILGIVGVVGTNVKKFTFILCIACTYLATILHDATIAILFCSSFAGLLSVLGMKPKMGKSSNFAKMLMVMVPLAASVGGAGTMIGGGRNPVAVEILYMVTGIHIDFLAYMLRNFPMVGVMSVGVWFVCWNIFRPEIKELPAVVVSEKLAPMGRDEKGVLIAFLCAFGVWLTTPLHGIHLSATAALMLLPIFLLRMVDHKETFRAFPWEAMWVFGAGVTMGLAMMHTGAGEWLAMQFMPLFVGMPWPIVFWASSLFSSMLSSIMSNTAATALILPVTVPLAEGLGISPSAIAIASPIATGFVMLVIGAPPMIIAYSFGYFSQVDFIKVGVVSSFLAQILLALMVSTYWPLVGLEDMPILGIW